MDWAERSSRDSAKQTPRGTQTAMQGRATELKVLAVECLRAFMEAGMENSDLPQVQKAIAMCSLYAPHTELLSHPRTNTANLWRKEKPGTSTDAQENAGAPHAIAATVLGEKLVATVMQENHQPPDVSCWKRSHMLALMYSTVHRLIGKYLCMSSCARPIVRENVLHSTSLCVQERFLHLKLFCILSLDFQWFIAPDSCAESRYG